MTRDRLNIGSIWKRRVTLGAAAVFAAAGCHSAENDDGFSTLDAKTRQMLLAPAGGSLTSPKHQYAVTDPAATGATGITPANSFNRGPMPAAVAQNEANASGNQVIMPSTTGMVQQASVNSPTTPVNPATMTLQPRIQQAHATTPVNSTPPVMPSAPATTQPIIHVINNNVNPTEPQAPNPPQFIPPPAPIAVAPPPVPAPIAVAPPAPLAVAPPTPIDVTPPPPVPAPIAVAPPAMPSVTPEPPKQPGFTTLSSPVEQPPLGLGPVIPAALPK